MTHGKILSEIRRGCRDRSGAAAIEMAIVFPLFLMVMLGILAYGVYFGAAHSAQQLAADAARASVAGLNTRERESLVASYVEKNAAEYPLISPGLIRATAEPSSTNPGDLIVVISYNATDLPIWGLSSFVPLPSQTINRTAVIRRGVQ